MQAPMCRDCFTGTVHDDVVPTGREEIVHGLPTYLTGPEPGAEPLGTVVIIPDAFGWRLPNTRLLADAYARRVPCTVYVPDFMNGHPLPESAITLLDPKPAPTASALSRLLARVWGTLRVIPPMVRFLYHNHAGASHPRVLAFLRALRSAAPGCGAQKLAVAGFCWGGLHAVRLTHDAPQNKYEAAAVVAVGGDGGGDAAAVVEKPLIDCAFTAHPSMLSFPGDLEAVARPLSVANGDDDQFMGREKMKRLVEILEGKNRGGEDENEKMYEAVMYPGAKHGFAVRWDPQEAVQREQGEQCTEQAVRWFRRWFGERR